MTKSSRTAEIHRKTRETDVTVKIAFGASVRSHCRSGVPFLDHMLDQVAQHGRLELDVTAQGDVEIDDHHTVEDIGITLGQAIQRALGDRSGIARAGSFTMPMDESLVLVAMDLSGRPFLEIALEIDGRRVGNFDCDLIPEFFRAVAVHAGMTLHIRQLAGANAHHLVEAAFKGFGRALDLAAAPDSRVTGVPSTKGVL